MLQYLSTIFLPNINIKIKYFGMAICSVDLADILSVDKKRKHSFIYALCKAYEEVGFIFE